LKKLLQKFVRKWRPILATAAFCHRITPVWRPSFSMVFLRARRLCRRDGFEPAEAFRLGLFLPRSHRHREVEYISRRRLTKIQESLNPVVWAPLLKSKDLFYRHCLAAEVPIPRLYAVIHGRLPGWIYTGHVLRTPSEWIAFLDNSLPAEFVVKRTEGAYGQGLQIFQKVPDGFMDTTGEHRATGDLYDWLISDPAVRYVIQERLCSHPELVRLAGTEALQTIRMITLVDNAGQVHILHAHLKVIEADEIVDTLLRGLTGNIEAPIHLRHGTLQAANRVPGTGAKVLTLSAHPKTRVAFEGFQLPFWTEACHLARQTALKFVPLRTVGWDVALTPDGPVIVEGNIWWDPPNQHGGMGKIFRLLSDPSLPATPQSRRTPGDPSPWHRLFQGDK
jgi:hypothetical protein